MIHKNLFKFVIAGTSTLFILACLGVEAKAQQSVTVPVPFDYTFDIDPSSTNCTNTGTNVELNGPLSINYGAPHLNIHFKQNERRFSSDLASIAISVAPTDVKGISVSKKDYVGMGNPYLSYLDNNPKVTIFGQLGRCVAQSSKSVYNRLRDSGTGNALVTAAISQISCSNRGSSIGLKSNHASNEVTGRIFLTNQLLSSPENFNGAQGNASLTVTVSPPGSYSKSGKADGVGGNPFVSFQVADCDLNNTGKTCKKALDDQIYEASKLTNPDTRFPFNKDGSTNENFEDATVPAKKWSDVKSIKEFKLWGPALTSETDPVRCNKLNVAN